VADEINGSGGEAISLRHDVTKPDDWDRVVRAAVERFGKLDILINNAGIGGEEGFAQIDAVDLEAWNKFMTVNATSNFLGIKSVVPEMRRNGRGSIVNISSMAGMIGGAAGVHRPVRLIDEQELALRSYQERHLGPVWTGAGSVLSTLPRRPPGVRTGARFTGDPLRRSPVGLSS
jgi:NAD(P)-dependent dehydrogenase (short-subunit alcohol dehydrogenase family)